MKKSLYYLKKIISAKWVFKLPPQKKILLYDGAGEHISSLFFAEKTYHILNIRFEIINLRLLLRTLIKNGFKNIKTNY